MSMEEVQLKMLTDTKENQKKNVTMTRRHRSLSKHDKISRSASSKGSERSQKKPPSSSKKRTNSLKLNTDEMKHQRFVNDLKNDIQVYINQRLRESRFDLRSNHCLQTNPILKIKQTTSTLGSHRRNKTDIISMYELLKREEIERLAADVQAILAGSALKNYYARFIQLQQQRQPSPRIHLRLLEESIL